jgi:hypothetical protein
MMTIHLLAFIRMPTNSREGKKAVALLFGTEEAVWTARKAPKTSRQQKKWMGLGPYVFCAQEDIWY